MAVLRGEPLAEGSWPPSLLAALQQWGTTQPKAPCLTALDTAGKAVYTLTYGEYQQEARGHTDVSSRGRGEQIPDDLTQRVGKQPCLTFPPAALPTSRDHPLYATSLCAFLTSGVQFCFISNFVKMALSSVFFWFGIFWFHFCFYVTQITCFGLSVFSWNTWPRSTAGAQAGVAQSQGQCPADHRCEYVPPAWAVSCSALSGTHPCTVWSVHPRPWVLFHPSADVRAAQSVDIWVVSTAGLLRVVLL